MLIVKVIQKRYLSESRFFSAIPTGIVCFYEKMPHRQRLLPQTPQQDFLLQGNHRNPPNSDSHNDNHLWHQAQQIQRRNPTRSGA